MEKSTNYIYAERLYESISEEQKKRISLDLFYNAIRCFHDVPGDKMADMLMALSDDEFAKLEKELSETRNAVSELQKAACEGANLNSAFASPDIADILLYQISNGLPIS